MARVTPEEIPLDLLFEILAKLPVKSLCRFRCVCKLWGSVIADPRFVEAHRARSAARPELLLLFRGLKQVDPQKLEYRAYTCELDATGMELHSPDGCGPSRTYRNLVPVQNPAVAVEGGCISPQVDGLYCLDFSRSVRLWNPNTRESLDIETVETESDYGFHSDNYFGFDPVEKKHKVLNILTKHGLASHRTAVRSRVFILEENCWRPTTNAPPPPPYYYSSNSGAREAICIDGIILFYYYGHKLMAFHVRSETFQEILLPEAYSQKTVIEFAGRAALVNSHFYEGITLWVLEDLQQQHVWTPKLKGRVVPNYDLGRMKLEGGTPAGELLFTGGRVQHRSIDDEPFFVLLYNVESNVARRIELQGLQLEKIVSPWIHSVHFHVQSLRSHTTYQGPQQIEV